MHTFATRAAKPEAGSVGSVRAGPALSAIRTSRGPAPRQQIGSETPEAFEAESRIVSSPRFDHDFSRIAIHSATIQPKLRVNVPGDAYEQEADRVADRVMRMPETPETRLQPGRALGAGAMIAPPIVHDVLRSSGHPLDASTRAFMEPRFGHDFSRVRVHTDASASGAAAAVGARAFTVGRDIVFGGGEYAPRSESGRQLLAHELTHVAQQSRIGPALQPKLKVTGKEPDIARVITLLNSGLQDHVVSADKSGDVKIEKKASKQKPNAQQQALASRLATIIDDTATVTISVSAGSKTLGGTFHTRNIDIADLEVYGVAGLIHELWEQYQGQVKKMDVGSETTGAHAEGKKIESEVMGAKRGAQKIIPGSYKLNAEKSIDVVLEIPFTYPDGKVKVMVMRVEKSNIVSFKEKPKQKP